MLGYYNYTVVLTYIGMLSGFTGLIYTLSGNLHAALLCLMIAGLCDMFDGRVASTRRRNDNERAFGVQIDSLSDLICFGVLPALMVYAACPKAGAIAPVLCGLYLLCALIRLAYFNVDETLRQQETQEARCRYRGLPVTTSALIVPLLFVLSHLFRFDLSVAAPAVLAAVAVAFLTPFCVRKPGLGGKVLLSAVGLAELVLILALGVG